MEKVHIAPKYFMNPLHPITVTVVGVGGNGTQVLTDLAKINSSLLQLNHPGFNVVAYDPDIIEQSNIGRQKFSEADLGQYKSDVLITRLNRFYGFDWFSISEEFTEKCEKTNIIISAVDNVQSRYVINKWFSKSNGYDDNKQYYWLDFGNGKDYGQYVLGSKYINQESKNLKVINKLNTVYDLFPNMEKFEEISGPSCSTREALQKQDLFINSVLVSTGMNLLWNLLTNYFIKFQGGFVNLETGTTKSIKL
jgi:PRTRC genetic system ThiF family protein